MVPNDLLNKLDEIFRIDNSALDCGYVHAGIEGFCEAAELYEELRPYLHNKGEISLKNTDIANAIYRAWTEGFDDGKAGKPEYQGWKSSQAHVEFVRWCNKPERESVTGEEEKIARGWFEEQYQLAVQESAEWPEWMKNFPNLSNKP